MSHSRTTPRILSSVVAYAQHFAASDEELLAAFVTRKEQAAFAVIVQRHGPMVLRVCSRVLDDQHLAEDAFQGTFLILAQQAASIHKRGSLGSWLHGTALRVATSAKRSANRSRNREDRTNPPLAELDPALRAAWQEVQVILDEEVRALPEIYREAFVRCCLEHASTAQVARELRVAEPTVRNRLLRARKKLQERLQSRGISLSAIGIVLAVSSGDAAVTSTAWLAGSTAKAAVALAAGQKLTELGLSPPVIALVKGASQAMILARVKLAVCVLMVGVAVIVGVAAGQTGPGVDKPPMAEKRSEPGDPAVAAELTKLEGTWVTEKHDEVYFYVFSSTKCTIIDASKKQASENRVDLDPTKSPKWLDFTERGEQSWEVIYELKGDTLRIAGQLEVVRGVPGVVPHITRSPRPTEFKDIDSQSMLLTLKRITGAPAPGLPVNRMPDLRLFGSYELSKTPAEPQDQDILVLEAQVKVKQAQVKAAEVRIASANECYKLVKTGYDAKVNALDELQKAKAEAAASEAELDVRKAELGEAEAKLGAARQKRETEAKLSDALRGGALTPPKTAPGPLERPKGGSDPAPKPPEPTEKLLVLEYGKGMLAKPNLEIHKLLHEIRSLSKTNIAISVDPEIRKGSTSFHVYVSTDSGLTWEFLKELDKNADSFLFQAPKDGGYFFGLRRIKINGDREPELSKLPVGLRIRVETPNQPKSAQSTTPHPLGALAAEEGGDAGRRHPIRSEFPAWAVAHSSGNRSANSAPAGLVGNSARTWVR
jgi:RNA polymerase sigma factor (sigma-70 family)